MSLLPNKTYYYRVKAINATQESDYSNTVAVTTLPDPDYNVTPLPATAPTLYKTVPASNRTEIYLQPFDAGEYIREIKLTLSINSDYSSPLYNSLAYIVDYNTNYAVVDASPYVVLTAANLAANTTYYAKVRAVNSISQSSETEFSFTTEKTLKAPVAIGITDLTSITATANWIKVTDATGYRIDVASNSDFSTLVVSNVDAGDVDAYDIPVLVENTLYYYRVRSYDGSITSKNSIVIPFTTLEAAETEPDLSLTLSPPSLRQTRNLNTQEIELIYGNVDYATSYVWDLSTSISFSSFVLQDQATTSPRIQLSGLTAGTLYYFRIKAVNATTESGYSSASFTTLAVNSSLNPAQVLAPTDIYSTAFILAWVKRNYASRYYIQLATVSNFSSVLRSLYVGDIDVVTLDGLTPNTSYYVRVYALNTTESAPVSNVVNVVTEATLPAVTLGTVSELGTSTVVLNWTTNAAYSRYLLSVYKKFTAADGDYLGDGFYNDRNLGNVASHLLSVFLEPATTYQYVISGITADGERTDSAVGEFTTRNRAAVFSLSSDGRYIEWGEECNRIEVATDKAFKFLVPGWYPRTVPASPKQFDISALVDDATSYYIRGYFDNSGLKGSYSNVVSTFGKPLLLAPTVTKTTALIRWKKSSSAGYRIQIKYDAGGGNYLPITGHTFPVNLGDTDQYFIEGLSANTNYSVQLQAATVSGYTKLSLPVYFKTNRYSAPDELTTNSGLSAPGLTLNGADFDRFNINITGSADLYLVEVSRRSDYLQIEEYFEVTDIDDPIPYFGEDGSAYYVRIYGIDLGTSRKSDPVTATISTTAIPSAGSALSGTPNISNATVINENEVTLTFNAVTNALGYTVEISQANTFSTLDTSCTVRFIDTNKVLVSGLLGTQTYYARAYAYNAYSISAYGSTQAIDTTP